MIKGDTIYVTLFDFCVSLICRSFDELEAELLKGQKLQVHTLNLLYETLNELFDISWHENSNVYTSKQLW